MERADLLSSDGDATNMWEGENVERFEDLSHLRRRTPAQRSSAALPYRKRAISPFVAGPAALALFCVLLFLLRKNIYFAYLRRRGVPAGLWSRDGILTVGVREPFMIKGANWYGLEDERHVPDGMQHTNVENIMNFLASNNFNALRLPLALDNVMKNAAAHLYISTFYNPELTGQKYLDILRILIQEAAKRHILVLLDLHRLQANKWPGNGLWYDEKVSESDVIDFWSRICSTFRNEWNVLGADLFNEPWAAEWNSANRSADWKGAAERIGNSLHEKCPRWLVVVEGVGNEAVPSTETPVFWGENLHVMESAPVRLKHSKKVAISPHVYGPSVHNQTYFGLDGAFDNMPPIWDNHFGTASNKTAQATVIGEWGGHYVGSDRAWQNKLQSYLKSRELGFFYWCLNPESSDTGGLLSNDWKTPRSDKLELIEKSPVTQVKPLIDHFKH